MGKLWESGIVSGVMEEGEENGEVMGKWECNGRNGQWLFAASLPNTLRCFDPHFFHKC